jgi:CheY-like chemotaxis protein
MEKIKILVVDDDPKLSRLVKLFLEQTKRYTVREENRSAHAVETAREFQPEAVLLDVDMPGKDGGQVQLELADDPYLKRLPVMFFTSLISPAEAGKHEVLRGGMPFLAKPVNPTALVQAVERLLSSRPEAAAAAA